MGVFNNITYKEAIDTIRELILDTNPVQCFKVSGQDFGFSKDGSGFVLNGELIPFDEVSKYFSLMEKLRIAKVDVQILPDYVSVEHTKYTLDFDFASISELSDSILREHYFSLEAIEKVMRDFYMYYGYYTEIPRTFEDLFNNLCYIDRLKLIYWVAYYLIGLKRMYYASNSEIIRQYDTESSDCPNEGELKNTKKSITTRVGEVFSVTESDADDGNGLDGFTSFWGDQYSYYTKLQLWLRDRFEKLFKDFSLRDDAMICQSFQIERVWQNDAWVDTMNFSETTRDVLQFDDRYIIGR